VTADAVLDVAGPAAPPRRNGELVFAAPWENRVFGVTLALHAAGLFAWEEFRRRLIAEIAESDAAPAGSERTYWACWLAALEELLAAKELCAAPELEARASVLAARPAGHDHAPR
jgi:nitrile hydratase accessory protein